MRTRISIPWIFFSVILAAPVLIEATLLKFILIDWFSLQKQMRRQYSHLDLILICTLMSVINTLFLFFLIFSCAIRRAISILNFSLGKFG
jgi:hypothetical protein